MPSSTSSTSAAFPDGGVNGTFAILWRTSKTVEPLIAGSPVSISWSMRPIENTSERGENSRFVTYSGAVYAGVPWNPVSAGSTPDTSDAMPKSMIRAMSSAAIITFAGFRSRCTTPLRCANSTAWSIWSV